MSKKSNPLDSGLSNILSTFQTVKPSEPPSPAPVEEVPTPPPITRKGPTASKPDAKPPKGKKSNADYYPTTVYMRKSISKRVQQALLAMDSKMDVSDVVEMVLDDWLKDRSF